MVSDEAKTRFARVCPSLAREADADCVMMIGEGWAHQADSLGPVPSSLHPDRTRVVMFVICVVGCSWSIFVPQPMPEEVPAVEVPNGHPARGALFLSLLEERP
jgi:hypothetical protein